MRRLSFAAALFVTVFCPALVAPVLAAEPGLPAPAMDAGVARTGSAANAADRGAQSDRDAEEEAVRLFRDALRAMRSRYVDDIPAEELARTAVRAMLGQDRWSTYLTAEEYEAIRMKGDGAMVGLGLRYLPTPDGLLVTETFPESPARHAGLEVGDLITAIDGAPAAGLDREAAAEALRGDAGSNVSLTVARGGAPGEAASLTLARGLLNVPSVEHAAIGDTGYVRIFKFDRQTEPGLERAVAALRAEIGAGMRGLVLDLRGNPGGLVRSAVGVADAFLEEGLILSQEGRDGKGRRSFHARSGDITDGLPLVLLVDGRSASSAEILAGALRDNGRAVLVGMKTYGKGVIQTFLPVKDGGAIKLTTARYITPAGHHVNGQGIAPDHVVPQPDGEEGTVRAGDPARDPQLAQALSLLPGAGPRPEGADAH